MISGNVVDTTATDDRNYGIVLASSRDNVITDNIVTTSSSSSDEYSRGIYVLTDSNNTVCTNNNITTRSENGDGIFFSWSSGSIINNTILTRGDRGDGIVVSYFSGAIENNKITTNSSGYAGTGIDASYILSTSIEDNIISLYGDGPAHGIDLYNSDYNNITDNTITVTSDQISHGIYLRDSSYDTITGNVIDSEHGFGIYLYPASATMSHYNHTIDTTNTEGGKPIHYYFDEASISLSALDLGEIYTAYSDTVVVDNVTLHEDGIVILGANNPVVKNCDIQNSMYCSSCGSRYLYAILIYDSSGADVSNNNISVGIGNCKGVMLSSSSNSNVDSNTIVTDGSGTDALVLENSPTSDITNNYIYTAGYYHGGAAGIDIDSSQGTDIINNTITTGGFYGSGANGIEIDASSDNCNIITNNITTIDDGDDTSPAYSIYLRSDNIDIISCLITIDESGGPYDTIGLFLWDANNVKVINTSYDRIQYGFAVGDLSRYWYVDVNVTDAGGSPISGADVTAWDVNSNEVFSDTTDGTGYITQQLVLEYNQSAMSTGYEQPKFGSETFYTDHIINATSGALVGSK